MKKLIQKYWKKLAGVIGTSALVIVLGYFAVVSGISWFQDLIDNKFNQHKTEMVQRLDDLEYTNHNQIRVLERKLDSTSTAVQAQTENIPTVNFWQKLFNSERNQLRDSVLKSIPEVIQKEMDKLDLKPESVGTAKLTVKGDTILFNSNTEEISGYWGKIEKINQDGEEVFQLALAPIRIKLNEIRTEKDKFSDQQKVYITAIDERNGEEIQISGTSFQFLDQKDTGFVVDPEFTAGLGFRIITENGVSPVVTGSLDWLKYIGDQRQYSFLSIQSNLYAEGNSINTFSTIGLVSVTF